MLPGFASGIRVGGIRALSISGTPVTTATEDSAYAGFTAVASGGTLPYTYSLVGLWPPGITVNSGSGAVSGTPTTPGTYASLSVRVTDGVAATADLAAFTITVAVSGATSQAMTPSAYVNSNGPRQSMLPGTFINEA
ncbi:hypothetical protein D3227_25750 [Mesorhizobium waimense]|uniref:Autotransporter outer membrane beta-barrel domain-containing protein n=1 Tax=Mesorhizobium waimense TaxID=1300307 RepID=A0A3A5KAY6_9HYPH|nr:putative Ig domain-containing protein [Mesorhizobium waimense]RJT32807.1 hypothetical protein D3227_25750 [Mesorhizobium waimense]